MYSLLMSDCAERAVSDACEGAATAAAGSAADTVTDSVMLATVSLTEISSVLPPDSCTPLRRTVSKPGTNTSTVYEPGVKPITVKRPLLSVVVVRTSPIISLRTTIGAATTALPSGSKTTPARMPMSVCAASNDGRKQAARMASRNSTRLAIGNLTENGVRVILACASNEAVNRM